MALMKGERYCVIHCGTRKIYDQWQYKKFARLVEVIPEKYNLKVIITCGPGEESQAESVLGMVKNRQVKSYIQTGLQELGAVTKGASFVQFVIMVVICIWRLY